MVRLEEHPAGLYQALGYQGRFSRKAFYKTKIPEEKVCISTLSFQFSFKKLESHSEYRYYICKHWLK